MMESRSSPCILVCKIDTQSNLCFGCFRSREEIAKWCEYDESTKLRIVEELKDRATLIGKV